MTPTELLTMVQDALIDVENMNAGGCAVFAAFVARRLEKMGIETNIRIGQFYTKPAPNAVAMARKENARYAPDYSRHDISFGHVIIEFKWMGETFHFDSDNLAPAAKTTKLCDFPIHSEPITPKECLLIARRRQGWNWMFNRKQIPFILRTVSKIFRENSVKTELTKHEQLTMFFA